jgi:hypothetical protein
MFILATGIQIVHQESPKPSVFLEVSVGVAVVVITSIFGYLVKKFNEDREDRKRSEEKIDRVYNALITADADELNRNPPLGLIDQTAAAVAVANEALAATTEATAETKLNSEAVLAMATRFGQQNGTVLDIQNEVSSLRNEVGQLHSLVEGVATVGANVQLDLDTGVASRATIAAESQNEILEAIHQHEGHTP